MMPIDNFINQLIRLGLADSFLNIIDNHYLKITKMYEAIFEIHEDNIQDMELFYNDENDSITLIIHLFEPVNDLVISSDKELTGNIVNNGNNIEITVTNNYESEDDIYENRFNGRRAFYTHKFS